MRIFFSSSGERQLSRALILGNKIDNIFGITLMGKVRVCYWGIIEAKCRKKRFNKVFLRSKSMREKTKLNIYKYVCVFIYIYVINIKKVVTIIFEKVRS
jgi:hypothetical protein